MRARRGPIGPGAGCWRPPRLARRAGRWRCRGRSVGGLCVRGRSWLFPAGLGGDFAAAPELGKLVSDEGESLGEISSVGVAFAELLHADPAGGKGPSVGGVENLAGVGGCTGRADGLGVGGGDVDRKFVMAGRRRRG